MSSRYFVLLFLFIINFPAFAGALANATIDAQKLAKCMREFSESACAQYIYTPYFQIRGLDLEQLHKMITEQNKRARAIGATYKKFVITPATREYVSDGKHFAIIPYSNILVANDREVHKESIFIGISEDGGRSWRFVEGFEMDQITIKQVIPTYNETKLPVRSMRFSQ